MRTTAKNAGKTILALTVILLLSVLNTFAAEENIVLKASGAWPQTSESTSVYFKFFDLVNEKSNGQLQIKWVGGPEFIKVRDLPTAARTGTIDVFQTCPGYLAGIVPEGAIADAYPIGRSYKTASSAYYEVLDIVSPIYEKKLAIKPIGQTLFFPFFLWTKNPVNTMKDIKGQKIRAHGGLVPFIVSELGGGPVTTPTTEVYVSLERGIVDGAVRNLPAVNSFKEYELAPYAVSEPVTWATADIFISSRAWKKLPKKFQNLLWETGKEITEINAKHWEKMDRVLMEKFSQQNVTMAKPDASMKKQWQAAIEKGANKGAKKLSPKNGPAIIEAYNKFSD